MPVNPKNSFEYSKQKQLSKVKRKRRTKQEILEDRYYGQREQLKNYLDDDDSIPSHKKSAILSFFKHIFLLVVILSIGYLFIHQQVRNSDDLNKTSSHVPTSSSY